MTSSAPHGIVRGHVAFAVTILQPRLAEPWTLSALADEVHLSRSQLVRAFDATVGMSPMAYLRQMRVDRCGQPAIRLPPLQ
jgi:AraC family L-rhamnose operon transcriptional activator RhaR